MKFTVGPLFALLLAIATPTPAQAQVSAAALERWCLDVDQVQADPDSANLDAILGASNCTMYLSGFLDMESIYGSLRPAAKLLCIRSPGLSINQARRIFLDYTNKNPSDLGESARVVIMLAIGKAFPCES